MNKTIIFAAAFILMFSAHALAEYSSNIREGNKAYSAGDYVRALKYYKEAFVEKPDMKLGNFIVQLESLAAKAAALKPGTLNAQTGRIAAPEKGKINPASVVIVISDIVLTGVLAYAYLDYNDAVDKYNVLYAQYDNTSYPDYMRMKAEYDKVGTKQNLFVISGSLAGAAILYTFLDVFVFHAAFPVDVSLNLEKNGLNLKTVLNRNF